MKIKSKKGRYFEKLPDNIETATEKILKAARKIFAVHTFNSATTRMIADEAGVDHSLIHYYFGSKENLFEAICERIFEEVNEANKSWLEGLDKLTVEDNFSLYLDRMLAYTFENPEPFKIIALNLVQAGTMNIPGYEYITKNIEFNQKIIEEKFPNWKNHPLSQSLLNSFAILVISYVGAKETFGKLKNIDPEKKEYVDFVKKSLYSLFLPLFKKLFSPE